VLASLGGSVAAWEDCGGAGDAGATSSAARLLKRSSSSGLQQFAKHLEPYWVLLTDLPVIILQVRTSAARPLNSLKYTQCI